MQSFWQQTTVDGFTVRREHYGISYSTVLKEHVDAFAPVVERLAYEGCRHFLSASYIFTHVAFLNSDFFQCKSNI